MNDAEYNHLHRYQDIKDAHQEKIGFRAEALRKEYWWDEGMLLEAIKEGLGEDVTYVHLAKKLIRQKDHIAFSIMTIDLLDKYLHEQAIEAAENELN